MSCDHCTDQEDQTQKGRPVEKGDPGMADLSFAAAHHHLFPCICLLSHVRRSDRLPEFRSY